MVDGFNLACHFKDLCPEGYQFLSDYPLEAEYVHVSSEPRSHYVNKDVAFKHCPQRCRIFIITYLVLVLTRSKKKFCRILIIASDGTEQCVCNI